MKADARNWRWIVAGTLAAGMAGCATTNAQVAKAPSSPEIVAAAEHGETFPTDAGFEIDRPRDEAWSLETDVLSPEGRPIPVVVAHPESGAQIVVQVSELTEPPEELAQLLRTKLAEEGFMKLGKTRKVDIDTGADAYGFDFEVENDAMGRVALITVGEQVVLVVASWPREADETLVRDIDGVVRSVRPSGGASPVMLTPDKA